MFSFPDAAKALRSSVELPQVPAEFYGASIDTRTVTPGQIFIALKGTKDDGHLFLEDAFKKGATGALISQAYFQSNQKHILAHSNIYRNLIPVLNPEHALRDLASWVRKQHQLPVIGVTGSVGKTTTKEFLAFILGSKHSVLSNLGNFNNHLGLPLTMLRLKKEHQFFVAEMGANHMGEIRALAALAQPTHAIITQIAPAHVEGFGGLENIYQAKLELAESIGPRQPLILPDHDPRLIEKAKKFQCALHLVGESDAADFRVSHTHVKAGFVHFKVNDRSYCFPGIGGFLAQNAAMAVAMAEVLGVKHKDIPEDWAEIKLPSGRFQEQILGEGIRVIFDGYNANPASFAKALEAFNHLSVEGKKYLVISDMLELGSEENKCHDELGRRIGGCAYEKVFAYGPRSARTIEVIHQEFPAHAEHFGSADELAAKLLKVLRPHDAVLLKASRGMKVERVLELLRQSHPSTMMGNAFSH